MKKQRLERQKTDYITKAKNLYGSAKSFYLGLMTLLAIANVVYNIIQFSIKGLAGSIFLLLVVLFFVGRLSDDGKKEKEEEEKDPLLAAADKMISDYGNESTKDTEDVPKEDIAPVPEPEQEQIIQKPKSIPNSLIIKHKD